MTPVPSRTRLVVDATAERTANDPMADVDDREALVAQTPDDLVDRCCLGDSERGRRLVHDHDPLVDAEGDAPRDRHHLPLPAREHPDVLIRSRRDTETGDDLPHLAPHPAVVELPDERERLVELTAGEDVPREVGTVEERQILVDHRAVFPPTRHPSFRFTKRGFVP